MKAYQLKNLRPATVWQDALPSGNGRIAALVYGNVYADKILFNHERWWYKESSPELPDFSKLLPKVRHLMESGNYAEADRVFPEEMARHKPLAAAALFQPGIDLRVESVLKGEFVNYARTLDMSTGEVCVRYSDQEDFCRQLFVSRTDEAAVVRIRGGRTWSGRVWLEPHELEKAVGIFGEPFAHGLTFCSSAEGNLLHLEGLRGKVGEKETGDFAIIGQEDREKHFGAFLRVCPKGGRLQVLPDSENDLNVMMPPQARAGLKGVLFEIQEAEELTLLVRLYEGEKERDLAKAELLAMETDYDVLFERHCSVHRELFLRTGVTFAKETDRANEELLLNAFERGADSELLNKLYFYGRYLLMISARKGCLPAHLSGKWNGDYFAPWRGVYFVDENSEIIYWQAYSGNMPELLLPLFALFESQLEDYRENAKKMFGCRGIRIPVYVDVFSGHEKDYSSHALYWNGGAAWIASMFYDYFDFTKNLKFLEEHAYPFMKETALFFEDFLVEKEGVLHCYPSTSPENSAHGTFEGEGRVNACIDATMDISLLRNLLSKLIDSANRLKKDGEKVQIWQAMLEKLPEYRINEDGALAEWIHPDFWDNYRHRHLSHLFPVFPGTEIGEEDQKLYDAARKALALRMKTGIKEMTGWALAHTANVYAHLLDAKGALNCLQLIARHFVGDNLFGYHNNDALMGVGVYIRWCNHAPHQLDVSSGFTSAVHEMLCFARGKKLYLLPALPEDWGDFKAYGIALRGGIQLKTLSRKGNCLQAQLISSVAQKFTVVLATSPKGIKVGNVSLSPSREFELELSENISVPLTIQF